MLGNLDRDISLSVLALFVLLLVGGIAMVNKANKDKIGLGLLPVAHRQLPALPLNAGGTGLQSGSTGLQLGSTSMQLGWTSASPNGFWGPCASCPPMAEVLRESPVLLKKLPKKSSRTSSVVPAWLYQSAGPGTRNGRRDPQPVMVQDPPRSPFEGGQRGMSADTARAAFSAAQGGGGGAGLLTPLEQNAADKIIVEGHWLGMETMDLTPALRKIYKISPDVAGVLVDEITLEAAESGILAGDVIISIQGRATPSLEEVVHVTQAVSERQKAEVVVNRLGVEKRFTLVAKNTSTLGFAQMEAAQPIRPGALSPHRDRGRACTDCHVIMMTGGQLSLDAGDIVPSPSPIDARAKLPHAYRGPCNSCHVIKTMGAVLGAANAVAPQPGMAGTKQAFSF